MALYVWGKNCALSMAATEREKTVVYPTLMEHFGSEVVTDYAAGDNHALAVTEFGDVYSWGRGKDGELGHGDPRDDQPVPLKIKGLQEHIVNVACGNIHSMATTITGHVYMWGLLHDEGPPTSTPDDNESSSSGMLMGMAEVRASTQNDPILARVVRDAEAAYREGTNEVSDFEQGVDKMTEHRHRQSVPRLATSLIGHFITKVSAGAGHNLALSANGEVFSCGYNEHGQLGLGHANTVSSFQLILSLQGLFVHDIVCGHQHNLAQVQLDGISRCFTWGLGALGQLGHGTRRSFATPRHVQGIAAAIVSVGAGSHHSVAVDEDGIVYTWGHSEYGQHGVAMAGHDLNDAREFFVPRKQQTLATTAPIVSVCCGSHYTLATGRDGRLYSWGWNTYGVLGVGHFLTTTAPQPIDKLNGYTIARVMAGCNQSGAIVDCMGAPHAMRFRRLIVGDHSSKRYDLALTVPTAVKSSLVHWVFLKARCPYLFGYCRAAVAAAPQLCGADHVPVVQVHFPDLPMLDSPVLKAILVYLYTDRLDIAIHKVAAVKEVAKVFALVHDLPFSIACKRTVGKQPGLAHMLNENAPLGHCTLTLHVALLDGAMRYAVGATLWSRQVVVVRTGHDDRGADPRVRRRLV
ncbi:hypothetical protein, variant 1 [Aphanomyces invadans]|uniref:BTB domain-containing protein n=1 Tax=Aphanomyces invadans TaxID=157072 RepID=A0A024TZ06_9STRA|nr:hypothetical protein, variant 1 [Aphanomyces invadans]ETV99248.1 hypothetical protein, variant 1 [Aphanomyces invadans]|eukprot:XP_008871804.1 hypothetical protein, variant 1 [Aphanomyces invadans]